MPDDVRTPKNSAKYWCEVERLQSLTGALPSAQDPSHLVHNTQFGEVDAVKGEGFLLSHGADEVDPLVRVRALILRGRIQEAVQTIEALKPVLTDHLELTEMTVEEARSLCFLGRWADAELLIRKCLEMKIEPVTQLTVRQMLCVTLFEQGCLSEAMVQLDRAESLASIFPHCVSAFYLHVLKVKVLLRCQGFASARGLLDQLWDHHLPSEGFNVETLAILSRAEVDYKRFAGQPHANWALAAFLAQRALGDEVYSALACLELDFALHRPDHPQLRPLVEHALATVDRAKRLNDEIAALTAGDPEPVSTSAVSIAKFLQSPAVPDSLGPLEANQLLVGGHFIRLKPFSKCDLRAQPMVAKAMRAVSRGPVEKQEFFRRVWGELKYASHLHDGTIRNLLHRVRDRAGYEIGLDKGIVRGEALIILSGDHDET